MDCQPQEDALQVQSRCAAKPLGWDIAAPDLLSRRPTCKNSKAALAFGSDLFYW